MQILIASLFFAGAAFCWAVALFGLRKGLAWAWFGIVYGASALATHFVLARYHSDFRAFLLWSAPYLIAFVMTFAVAVILGISHVAIRTIFEEGS